jgi:cysteine synthase A
LARGRKDVFLPCQFSNQANSETHYLSAGPEIASQLARDGLRAAVFVADVGTGGTMMGAGAYLGIQDRRIRVHPVEPAESPTLSTGVKKG